MIKKYVQGQTGCHIVGVTFMHEDYKGHVSWKEFGNCRGLDILYLDDCCEFEDPDFINNLIDNDCGLKLIEEGGEYVELTLTNESGDKLLLEVNTEELSDFVVKVEIEDYIPDWEDRK